MMNIILAGYIALEATHKLIQNEKPALCCRFSDRFLRITDEKTRMYNINHDSMIDILKASSFSISEDSLMELSDMGIFGGLWEYAESHNCGLNVKIENISVIQETIEICELLNVNPYTYPSKGAWLIRSEKAYELAEILNSNGIVASVIGCETDLKDRVIINQDEVRYLTPIDRLLSDEQGLNNLR